MAREDKHRMHSRKQRRRQSNAHLRQRIARRRTRDRRLLSTSDKLWNVWASVKALFKPENVPSGRVEPQDTSKSTIDSSLEYVPVQEPSQDHKEESMEELRSQITLLKRKLQYAREKNTLYKSLLDDAAIGTTYLESRRHIRNLVRANVKPEVELPPSPDRKLPPLVTSSPLRNGNHHATTEDPPQLKSYYSKYRTLPHTEALSVKHDQVNNNNSKQD